MKRASQAPWPEFAGPGQVVPMFPLPGVFLFPGTMMPLHIFEPRYRQMIEDSLDGPGRIVMGTVLEGHEPELALAPPVHAIAGLGEIMRHDRLPDGRFLILLAGLARVRLREAPSERAYRKVEILPLEEHEPDPIDAIALRADLVAALQARSPEALDLPAQLQLSQLADLLLIRLELPVSELLPLYSTLDIGVRARRALTLHVARPPRAP
ncbi:MAG: peptidase S16 [Planctomycetes bacterium]|nr:peptidase S16 [Planctomycetota bacterium]